MKKIIFISAVACLIGFTACEKENAFNAPNAIKTKDYPILKFDNEYDFIQAIEKVSSFENRHQRIAWERSLNFKSFGAICDDFYDNIDRSAFSDFEEAKAFIERNDQYVELITDKNGDLYCEPKNSRDPERYLMNEDGMYIIGDKVYKKIGTTYITADKTNLELLKATADLSNAIQNKDFTITENAGSHVYKSTKAAGRTSAEGKSDFTIGKEHYRLKVWIEVKKTGGTFVSNLLTSSTCHPKIIFK